MTPAAPPDRAVHPRRVVRHRLRRRLAGRRRDHGQPLRHHPLPRRPPGQVHLRPRPRAHRRRGGAMVGRPAHRHRPADLVREAAMPYRSVFDVVWSGPPPHHDDGQPDRPDGQPEHLGHRRPPPAQGPADRRARAPRELGQPPHQLLGARPHRAHASSSRSTWSAASGTPGPRPPGRAPPASTTSAASSPIWASSTSRPPTTPCGCARSTPASPSTTCVRATALRPRPSPTTWHETRLPTPEELELLRTVLDPGPSETGK